MDSKEIERKEEKYADLRGHLIADHGLKGDVADEVCALLAKKEQGEVFPGDAGADQAGQSAGAREHLIVDHGLTEDVADEVCAILSSAKK